MKKILLVLLVALSTATFAIDSHVRIGALTNAKDYGNEDAGSSYAPVVGLEVTQSFIVFDIGAGAQYNGEVDGTDMATAPVYGLVRWNIIPIGIKPYLVAKAGKMMYSSDGKSGSDAEGDDFYGAGVGVNVSNLQVEALYSITKLNDTENRRDDELKQLALTFGYKIW